MLPYSTYCLSHPKALALTPKQVKRFLKVDHDFDDDIIIALIKSVTTQCQNYIGHALITQSWQTTYERVVRSSIRLPHKPVTQIDKVYLINHKDRKIIYPDKFYGLVQELSEIEFYIQPISKRIRIEYTCGFGDSYESIPEELQTAMLQHIAYIYEHRGDGKEFNFGIYNNFKAIRF